MKTFIIFVIGCGIGFFANIVYGSYLLAQVEADYGGDIYQQCEDLLNNNE